MLVVLQCSVNNILCHNQNLKEEMLALKLSVDTQGREFQKMKESVERITKENESLKNELLLAKGKLKEQKEEMQSLWSSLDDLEQYTRKNSLEIARVPESCYASTEEVVLNVAKALNVVITPNNIEISQKLRCHGATNTIIAKFVSHKAKRELCKGRIKLKDIKLADIYPSYGSAINTSRLFINKNLMNFRCHLLGRANGMKIDGLLLGTWTINGKVFVKTSPDGTPARILGDADSDKL